MFLVAPAWADTKDVTVGNFAFTPDTVHVAPGGTVSWRFAGPDTNHSVTSDSGQTESFDSDPGNDSPLHAPGTTFSHTFPSEGRFTYHCKVHSFMHGTVVVGTPPSRPPRDTTPPRVSGVKVRAGRSCHKRKHCHKRATRISFQLSEAARVRIAFKRAKGKRPKPVVRQEPAGPSRVKLSLKRLPRGRYVVRLVATDAAGNASDPVKRKLRVR